MIGYRWARGEPARLAEFSLVMTLAVPNVSIMIPVRAPLRAPLVQQLCVGATNLPH